jgi:hypothetical protein
MFRIIASDEGLGIFVCVRNQCRHFAFRSKETQGGQKEMYEDQVKDEEETPE